MTNNAKWGKKSGWPTIAFRIPPDVKEQLTKKHNNSGDLTKLMNALLKKYLSGQILGVKLEEN